MKETTDSLPIHVQPDDTIRLRDLFSSVDYSEAGIIQHLSCTESVLFNVKEIPRLLRLTSGETPLDILIRLFLCNIPVDMASVARAVHPLSVDFLYQAGLLKKDSDGLLATLRLVPSGSFLVGFDPSPLTTGKERTADHVHGMGSSSVNLLDVTVRRKCRSTLDLGTGCGIQGMMCATHSDQVVSTDVNPRALAIARFNAALNGLSNMTFRQGASFSPVEGERFDLIVMNPPFAISPDVRFAFRDAGMEGDGFVRQIVRDAPGHLTDGGMCQLTAQWAHIKDEPWQERLAEWVADSGCDAWILLLYSQSKESYVTSWLSETENHDTQSLIRRWESWMHYLDNMGVDRISTGIINLRRTGKPSTWYWTNDDADTIDDKAGDAILRGFALRDYLNETPDQAILETPFAISPDARVEHLSRSDGEGWTPEKVVLRQTSGIHYTGNLDGLMVGILGQCNGKRPLIGLIDELAASLNTEPTAVVGSILKIARNLIERGFLLPPGISDEKGS